MFICCDFVQLCTRQIKDFQTILWLKTKDQGVDGNKRMRQIVLVLLVASTRTRLGKN